MNIADSERMAGVLEHEGYQETKDINNADIVVFNTCSIREKSEEKVYSALGRQVKRKQSKGEDLKLIVAGCVASQEGTNLIRRIPEIDIVMGNYNFI